MTLDAPILVQNDMAVPGQRIFRTGHDAELFLAGHADFNPPYLRPIILDVNPCLFDTLKTRFMGGGAGQHTQPAVSAVALSDFEHGPFSLLEFDEAAQPCSGSHLHS